MRIAIVGFASSFSGGALADGCDGQWLPGYGTPGVSGTVRSMVRWDPDGPGPMPESLVIGGSFTMVDKTPARNLAMWDGTAWTEIGGGTNGSVNVLAVYQGKLCASGSFTQAGGNPSGVLAVWDGVAWASAGSEPSAVNAMLVYQGDLVVAGNLTVSGTGARIARWNGTTWSALGVNSAIGSEVYALAEFQGKLIAGGSFTTAGGNAAGGIAAWDGTWTALGSGVPSTTFVKSLLVHAGILFAGGNFLTMSGVSSPYLAKWTGSQWQASGAPYSIAGSATAVNALASFDGKLIAGGSTSPHRTYAWDGNAWTKFGRNIFPAVYCLQPFGNLFYAGFDGGGATPLGRGLTVYREGDWRPAAEGFSGAFVSAASYRGKLVLGPFAKVPGSDATNVVSWNGARWKGMKGETLESVTSVRAQGGDLFVGTTPFLPFASQGPVNKWNGSDWVPFASQLDQTSYSNYPTFLSEYNGSLLVLGGFAFAGTPNVRFIGFRNGAEWEPIGGGLIDPADSAVVFQNELVIAGTRLQQIPGVIPNRVLKYDGVSWKAIIPGLTSNDLQQPLQLQVLGNKLVVAGSRLSMNSVNYGAIGAWNGAAFSWLDGTAQSSINGTVRSMAEYHGHLIAAGTFTQAGSVPASNIARWNGTVWEPLGSGLNGGAYGATVWKDEVIVSGLFTTAGGEPSAYFARWTDDPTPWVAVNPISQPANEGLTLTLAAAAARGYADVTYKWQRNGVDVVDGAGGASPGGGTVAGASGSLASPSDGANVLLTISGVQGSDSGNYTIVFSNGCNDAASTAAVVAVNTCPGDLNVDGVIDDADFTIFVGAYNVLVCEDPSMSIGCPADLNGDALVDDLDFQGFVVGYDQLVCG